MKHFSKSELIGIITIFLILFTISIPNFILSMRRARDQVRRDDLGTIDAGLGEYFNDFGVYPLSTQDGQIQACKKEGTNITKDVAGHLIANIVGCRWSKDGLLDLTPGSSKIYIGTIPADPDYLKGPQYVYFSDGIRYQIFASFEGRDEVGYDQKIVDRNIKCGTAICNTGRFFGCPLEKSIAQCEYEDSIKK